VLDLTGCGIGDCVGGRAIAEALGYVEKNSPGSFAMPITVVLLC
jgi:hypothetical protein